MRRPGLLLPAVAADVLALCLDWIRTALVLALGRAELRREFSPRSPVHQSTLLSSYDILVGFGGTTRIVTTFLTLFVYTAALLTTVALFRQSSWNRPFEMAVGTIGDSMKPIVLFCLKLLAWVTGAMLLLMLIYAVGENRVFTTTTGLVTMFSSLALAGVAAVVAPMAYRLLDRQGAMPLSRADRGSLRLAAFTCVAGSGLVSLVCTALAHHIFSVYESVWLQIVVASVISLIHALPYSILFISLAVVSVEPASETPVFETTADRAEEPG